MIRSAVPLKMVTSEFSDSIDPPSMRGSRACAIASFDAFSHGAMASEPCRESIRKLSSGFDHVLDGREPNVMDPEPVSITTFFYGYRKIRFNRALFENQGVRFNQAQMPVPKSNNNIFRATHFLRMADSKVSKVR